MISRRYKINHQKELLSVRLKLVVHYSNLAILKIKCINRILFSLKISRLTISLLSSRILTLSVRTWPILCQLQFFKVGSLVSLTSKKAANLLSPWVATNGCIKISGVTRFPLKMSTAEKAARLPKTSRSPKCRAAILCPQQLTHLGSRASSAANTRVKWGSYLRPVKEPRLFKDHRLILTHWKGKRRAHFKTSLPCPFFNTGCRTSLGRSLDSPSTSTSSSPLNLTTYQCCKPSRSCFRSLTASCRFRWSILIHLYMMFVAVKVVSLCSIKGSFCSPKKIAVKEALS